MTDRALSRGSRKKLARAHGRVSVRAECAIAEPLELVPERATETKHRLDGIGEGVGRTASGSASVHPKLGRLAPSPTSRCGASDSNNNEHPMVVRSIARQHASNG